jgi:UDP-N-acetyl-D-mannosaminuronic acid transferase (WecB/TagA/CpsF family)
MTVAGEHLNAVTRPRAYGIPFHDLDFDLALGVAESLARFSGGRNAVSFLNAGLMLRCMVDAAERRAVSRRLILPSSGPVCAQLLRLMGVPALAARFSAETFVPALLTYAEAPLRIGVLGETADEVARVCDRLQRHAPWHEVRACSADRECDMLIVGASRRLPAGKPPANLTIFVGRDLKVLAAPRA